MLDIFLKNSPQLFPRYQDIVTKINALEPEIKKLTQEQLQHKVNELKRELQNGTNKTSLIPIVCIGETLEQRKNGNKNIFCSIYFCFINSAIICTMCYVQSSC